MNMLRYFFEYGCNRELFDGLEISRETDYCEKYMGKFPVISITLKGVSAMDYAGAKSMLRTIIGNEALRFLFLKESPELSAEERESYRQLIEIDPQGRQKFSMSDDMLADSLRTLSDLLRKHYGQKVILLIGEYDVLLDKARQSGHYDEMGLRHLRCQEIHAHGIEHCLRATHQDRGQHSRIGVRSGSPEDVQHKPGCGRGGKKIYNQQ
ncbi:AAA family ATPase [Acetatifactor muris]|uniref:AAA family ATPase n=1 Tax=Acetatifactor muris TaxID=879566 RepID=UPI0027D461BC|nr:AAA family ATPase [Acetatifactor muris]